VLKIADSAKSGHSSFGFTAQSFKKRPICAPDRGFKQDVYRRWSCLSKEA